MTNTKGETAVPFALVARTPCLSPHFLWMGADLGQVREDSVLALAQVHSWEAAACVRRSPVVCQQALA